MRDQFNKILDLVKKTGDKVIVFDKFDPEKSYVVMDLDSYEMLVDDNFCDCEDINWEPEEDFYKKYKDYRDDSLVAPASVNSRNEFFGDDDDEIFDNPELYNKEDVDSVDFEEDNEFESDDFMPNFSERSTEEGCLDNISDYGTMEQSESDFKKNEEKGGRWSIPSDIKESSTEESAAPDEDRYYLEQI